MKPKDLFVDDYEVCLDYNRALKHYKSWHSRTWSTSDILFLNVLAEYRERNSKEERALLS